MSMAVDFLKNESFAKFSKNARNAVLVTTALKVVGRPAFIMADKKYDHETKKYTAEKEVLYQLLSLAMALAFIPFFEIGGYKLAEKQLIGKGKPLEDVVRKISETGLFKKLDQFKTEFDTIKSGSDEIAKNAMLKTKGAIEVGSLIGSITGLTIVAPLISHKILHPLMNALGMEKKHGAPEPVLDVKKQSSPTEVKKVNVTA